MLVHPSFQSVEDTDLAVKVGTIFEDGFAANRRPDGFMQKVSFAPSSIGPKYSSSCSRRWVLAFQGQEWQETTSGQSVAVMNSGTDAHKRLQDILEAAGVAVEIEKELKLEYPPIRGFADGIIDVDDQSYVVEIKTTRSEAFESYQLRGKPNISHVLQVLIYMHITGFPGMIVYQNSNSKELMIFPVHYDEQLLNKTLNWLTQVYDAYKADKLPVRDLYAYGTKPSKECGNCPVRQACADLPAGDIKIGKFTV